MQAELVEAARTIGVAMGSRMNGHVIGWTTDEAKATACAEAGLSITTGDNATGPRGWEVRAPADPPEEGEDAPSREGMED